MEPKKDPVSAKSASEDAPPENARVSTRRAEIRAALLTLPVILTLASNASAATGYVKKCTNGTTVGCP